MFCVVAGERPSCAPDGRGKEQHNKEEEEEELCGKSSSLRLVSDKASGRPGWWAHSRCGLISAGAVAVDAAASLAGEPAKLGGADDTANQQRPFAFLVGKGLSAREFRVFSGRLAGWPNLGRLNTRRASDWALAQLGGGDDGGDDASAAEPQQRQSAAGAQAAQAERRQDNNNNKSIDDDANRTRAVVVDTANRQTDRQLLAHAGRQVKMIEQLAAFFSL